MKYDFQINEWNYVMKGHNEDYKGNPYQDLLGDNRQYALEQIIALMYGWA